MTTSRSRAIGPDERSGVLRPGNLERFSAQWIAPAPDVRDVVDTYWAVRWHLEAGESIEQRIIDHPSVTLSIEQGDVLAPFVVSSARSSAWTRSITGSGDVFAVRLRPAGLAVLSDLDPRSLGPEQELATEFDGRAHAVLTVIAAGASPAERAELADAAVRQRLAERPLRPAQRLANAAVDAITRRPHVQKVDDVAAELGTSRRTLQRALAQQVGRGPGEIARRVRLQEVVRRLSAPGGEIAQIAVELGYADQAHLTNDFRAVAGVTPGVYVDTLMQPGVIN